MAKEFQGKLALVTGGGSGIGAEVSKDLAQGGASVVVADLTVEKAQAILNTLPTDGGLKHVALAVDVRKKAQVEEVINKIKSLYGRPANLIVNSAGVASGCAPIEDIKEEDLDAVVDINFKGTFLVTQAAGRALLDENQPGAIVNVASVAASLAWNGMSHYGASKAAVCQMTKVVGKEWGTKGIRVNAVCPGLTETPLIHGWEETKKAYCVLNAMERLGTTKEISDSILYLLSDRSSYVNGTSLLVAGMGN